MDRRFAARVADFRLPVDSPERFHGQRGVGRAEVSWAEQGWNRSGRHGVQPWDGG